MRILLVYPEMQDTFYAMRHFNEIIGKKATVPPLGLLTVASMLPKEWEKRLVDLNVSPLLDADLQWADYIFLSGINVQEDSVREILAQCQKNNSRVVAGGPLFTHEHDRFEGVDHYVLNEAEITLPLFLADLEKGEAKKIYTSQEFADVHQTPLPDLSLVDMSNYLYAIVQYSRGCPYLCDFCDVTSLFGRKPRTKTSQQILAELDAINQNEDVRAVFFADDNLIGNKRILKSDLLPALIEWRKRTKSPIYFATQLTVNLTDDEELMQLMLEAGFRNVFIGIESPEEENLKGSHKTQNLKRNLLDSLHKLLDRGFIVSGGFIVGFDTDTERNFAVLRDFIQESGIPFPMVNVLKAPPGTELYNRMKRENRLNDQANSVEGATNFIPLLGEDVILRGFLHVVEGVYPPRQVYERMKIFLQYYRYPKVENRVPLPKIRLKDLVYPYRVFYRLGIKDPDRKYFWKLLLWTLKNHPKYWDQALVYGVAMYQMKQTYNLTRRKVENRIFQLSQQKNPAGIVTDIH